MTALEYGIVRLIPVWSTNPDLPAGQPYPGDGGRVDGPFRSPAAVEAFTAGWEPGTWQVLVRDVTDWRPADNPPPSGRNP